MNNKHFLIALLLLGAMVQTSCKSGKTSELNNADVVAERVTVRNSELISCHLTKLKDTVNLPLSLFAEELRLVKFDNKDEALVGGGATVVTDNYILVRNKRNNPFKLFDKNGKFLTAVGAYGQGPNEYLNVYDEMMDEKSNQIFILPWQTDKVLRFNLQGQPLDPIPLKYRVPKGKIFVDAAQSRISVFLLPFAGIPVVAWTQDFTGSMIDSIPSGHLAVQPDFSNEVQSDKNTGEFDCSLFTFFDQRPDSVYHYNAATHTLDPKFTLDFNGKPWKIHRYQELPLHFVGNVTVEKKLSEYTSTTEYPAKFIVDKKTLKGAYYTLYNDYLGDMPIDWAQFYNGYYVWNVDPSELSEKLETQLKSNTSLTGKERDRLQKMVDEIDENDNNYVFIGKLKR